jgi:CRP-like cAMP-binding protein
MNPFLAKMASAAPLTSADLAELDRATQRIHYVQAKEDLIRQGDVPGDVHLVLDGFACRYKVLSNGRRAIMAYLIPGDFCDLHVAILGQMDHSIGALSRCQVAELPREEILRLTENPRIARALWFATLVDEATLREWLVSMGQRSADRQMAHLFCELHLRLKLVGLGDRRGYELPLTQEELADTLGLSTVHVNRVLQKLRRDGLIGFANGRLKLMDLDRLMAFAEFDAAYLHMAGSARLHAVERLTARAGTAS